MADLESADCPSLVNLIVIWKKRNLVQRSSRYSFGFCDGNTGNLDLPAWPHILRVIRFSERKQSAIGNRKDVWLPKEKNDLYRDFLSTSWNDKTFHGIYACNVFLTF